VFNVQRTLGPASSDTTVLLILLECHHVTLPFHRE